MVDAPFKSLLRTGYVALKSRRATSALLQAADVVVPRRLAGIRVPVYSRLISNHWVRTSYEATARRSFSQIYQAIGASTLFDLGANVGIYALEFLSEGDGRDALALEPNARVFACLTRSARDLSALRIERAAVCARPGEVELHFDPMSPALGGIKPGEDGLFNSQRSYGGFLETETVPCVTIDALSDRYFLPDAIKLDVEGAELAALSGASETLTERKPALCLECSRDREALQALLRDYGYQLFGENLAPIEAPQFLTFALHSERHQYLIEQLVRGTRS